MAEIRLQVTDMHTAGEPVRIVTGGYPELEGNTILDRRRDAMENHDHLRALMMREPRGHAEMYGVIPTGPCWDAAALSVLFTHNGGYSTMCGHATIAMGRWILDQGLVEITEGETRFTLECPCGPVEVRVAVAGGKPGAVSFESVAGYLHDRDLVVDTRLSGKVTVDIAYGGAYYAFVSAQELGINLRGTPLEAIKACAVDITEALRACHTITHPDEPDLGFLYGTIITDQPGVSLDSINHHLCYFAEGQLDRSPTGSGVTARLAMEYAKGHLDIGDSARFAGISGVPFEGQLSRTGTIADYKAAHTIVSGEAFYSGTAEFVLEDRDPLASGYLDPATPGDIWAR